MSKIWLLVTDAPKASLLEMPREVGSQTEIACFTGPNGRSPGQRHEHGRQERTQESANSARHAIEPHTSLRKKHTGRFADLLRDTIRRGRMENRFEQLVLMAPPRFLGVLRDRLDDQAPKCVTAEVGDDQLARSLDEPHAYLPT